MKVSANIHVAKAIATPRVQIAIEKAISNHVHRERGENVLVKNGLAWEHN